MPTCTHFMFLINFILMYCRVVALRVCCLLFLLFLSFSTLSLHAQQATWDSTHRTAMYDTRVQFYKGFPKSEKSIVFLGNSITFWGAWDRFLRNEQVQNHGIPGDNTFGVLERLDDIIQGQPEKIFLMIGINDLGRNTPDSVIIANCTEMMSRIRKGSPRTAVYFQSMLPTNADSGKLKHLYHKNDRIRYINGELEKVSKSLGVTWIDLHPLLADGQGNLKAEYTYDGVHLLFEGYKVWAAFLQERGYLPAQAFTWDSTSKTTVYTARVQFYKESPKSKEDIVFLGDNMTFWGEWSSFLKNKHIKNYGIQHDNTVGVLKRLDDVIQGQPKKIFLMIGINDLGRDTPDSVIIANCTEVMSRIRKGSPQTTVYFQSMLPTNPWFNKVKHLYHKNDRIRYINGELEKIAKSWGVTWVDLYSFLADERGELKFEYTYDGVHLTFKGYTAWADVLRDKGYLDFP